MEVLNYSYDDNTPNYYDVTDEEIIEMLINNIDFVKYPPFQIRLEKILIKFQYSS